MRHSLFRYPGAKGFISRQIINHFPRNSQLHYVEPFVGSATVAVRTLREVSFASYSLSDSFSWLVRALQAIRGDNTEWGDIQDRCRQACSLLLPESNNEHSIRDYFDECRDRCREGDPWSYLFLCQYAKDQYVYPQRANVASFDARYFGAGLSKLTIDMLSSWRVFLTRATIEQADVFAILSGLDSRHFVYLDPPYLSSGFRMYGVEPIDSLTFHERLRECLYNARFKWAISLANHRLVREWYLRHYFATRVFYRGNASRNTYPRQWEWLFCNYRI